YHEQVKVTPSSTLLFRIEDGQRRVIHRSNGDFVCGERKIPREQLLADIGQHPENYSANVLLRPVVQDFLLPNLAYIGGPAEVAYFAQGAVVYEHILGRVTPVLPRFSASIVDSRAQRHLARYHLQLTDLFHGPERLRDMLALRSLPEDLQLKFDRAAEAVEGSLHSIRTSLSTLDPTLVEAASKAGSKMLYQLRRLGMRAAHAELRKSGEISRHADELSTALFPEKGLQERHVAGICYVGRYGRQLLADLKPLAQAACPDHKVVYV
ncbi:MAG TPA: bacillithiol biosynthesis BshC, partial [Terriglobales bacterium]|nr:bacillithiol biosynthesis BshC [Terriglobales bacterium]